MSGALAIAAVTAALKDLLNNGLIDHDLSSIGSFSVTAQPPDRITTGSTEANQLNLFLYQVTPNLGWRNADLPSRDSAGVRIANPPLALDLHYLLTAYGSEDLNAEVLLGFAMQLLHETPVLAREQLRIALSAPQPPPDGTLAPGPFGTLSAVDLADQVELVKIAPEFLSAEDLSKLWTAMQARYRPSMSYLITVVLIRAEGGARVAPPVLQRGKDDRGPTAGGTPPPTLVMVRNLASPLLPAARQGDDLALAGANLAQIDAPVARFECSKLSIVHDLPVLSGASPGELVVHLPAKADDAEAIADWAAGVYVVSLRVAAPDKPAWSTDGVRFVIAPRIAFAQPAATKNTAFGLTVSCEPRLRPLQEAGARLIVGSTEVVPDLVTTPVTAPGDAPEPSKLAFTIPGLPEGKHLVRLRVDGIDSLPVLLGGTPPTFSFDPDQMVTVT